MSTLSVAMIVKDVAAYIEPCLRSVIPVADEFVIVDTGSSDGTIRTIETILRVAGKPYRIVTATPDSQAHLFMLDDEKLAEQGVPPPFTGQWMLADFAGARQLGWDLTTGDAVLWIDSDDVLAGADQLRPLVDRMLAEGVDTLMLPYDYAQDAHGNITCTLLRERVIRRLGPSRWAQPVHEVLSPAGNVRVVENGPRIVHQRHKVKVKTDVPHRNLKILLSHYGRELAKVGGVPANVDARLFFYLGMELRFVSPDRAMEFFDLHARHSGWDEEKSVGRMWRGEILESQGKLHEAYGEYCAAAVEFAGRPDPLFRLSRNAYFRNEWGKVIEHAEKGWRMMKEGMHQSVIQFDPMERELMPFVFASVAYLRLGRIHEALGVCNRGLKIRPDEPYLLGNKQVAEKWLADAAASSAAMPGPARVDFKFSDPIENPPNDLAPQLEAMFAIHLWKRLRQEGARDKMERLLENLPQAALRISKIDEARRSMRARAIPVAASVVAKMDIALWIGPSWEDWSPRSLDTIGIGGSETAAIHIARELARRGHRVRVFNQCGPDAGVHDGVEYADFNAALRDPIDADVLVASRQALALTHPNLHAKARVLWVHDIHCGIGPEIDGALARADRVFCLSTWHRGFFCGTYQNLDPGKVHVTRNSVDMARFAAEPAKLGNRLIYASSPDRGLMRLLELFPRIRARVPDAELHVYYGFDTWEKMAAGNAAEQQRIAVFRNAIAGCAGVVHHGRVNQRELAEAYLAAKVLAMPNWFTETSCISAMEAQAAGCVPVVARVAALAETVKHGVLLNPPETTAAFGDLFVNVVVEMLTNEAVRGPCAANARAMARVSYGWDKVAAEWEASFAELLGRRAPAVLRPYGEDEL